MNTPVTTPCAAPPFRAFGAPDAPSLSAVDSPALSRWQAPATPARSPFSRTMTLAAVVLAHLALGGGLFWRSADRAPESPPKVYNLSVRLSERPSHPTVTAPPRPLPPVVRAAPRPPRPVPLPVLAAAAAPVAADAFTVPAPSAVARDPEPAMAPPPPPPAVAVPAAAYVAPRFDADYLHNPAPDYPALARRRGEQGEVLLDVRVSAEGRALRVAVNRSSGYRLLDDEAQAAVRQWRFVPARSGLQAVEASVQVPISFRLERG